MTTLAPTADENIQEKMPSMCTSGIYTIMMAKCSIVNYVTSSVKPRVLSTCIRAITTGHHHSSEIVACLL